MTPRYQTDDELRTALAGLFTTRCRGREQARTMRLIRSRRPFSRWHERQVRAAIAELVELDGLPIAGDCCTGYYLAVTADERLRQLRQLGGRLRHLGRRFRAFARGAADAQLQLDYSLGASRIDQAMARFEAVIEALEGGEVDE